MTQNEPNWTHDDVMEELYGRCEGTGTDRVEAMIKTLLGLVPIAVVLRCIEIADDAYSDGVDAGYYSGSGW